MTPGYRTIRMQGLSAAFRPRAAVALSLIALTVLALMGCSIALGSTWIPPERLLAAVLGGGAPTDALIVNEFRLPRALLATLVGACLGAAGLLLQRATRNALASPTVLGMVDGAGVAILAFLIIFSDANDSLLVSIRWQPAAAACGALLFMATVFILAKEQRSTPIRLILFGVAVAAVAKAVISILIVSGPIFRASQATRWLAGALNAATWDAVLIVAPLAAAVILSAFAFTRRMDVLDLDQDSSEGVGVASASNRLFLFVLAALLTAIAVAFVGGIGFVGLIAPHVAMMLLGRASAAALAGSILIGAFLVLMADLIVRFAFAPIEVPAGTVTALVGAPYLLYLLTKSSARDG